MAVDAAGLALKVFIEAVRRGFPYRFRRVSNSIVGVESPRGKGVVFVRVVESRLLVAQPDPYTAWYAVLAELDSRFRLSRMFPENVPRALVHNEHLISSFEVDVWSRRLSLYPRLRRADNTPPLLMPYRVLGAEIMFLEETMDYAAVVDGVVVAWYNEATGRLDDNLANARAMGLL